jgi:hypothetical protein
VELAAPPGSDWCGDKKRSQGGEKGTLSGGESTACRRNCKGGNMSGLPSEPLRKGGPMCPYLPYTVKNAVELFFAFHPDVEKIQYH